MAHDDHGNTPAAWTAVAVVLGAMAVGGVGVMTANWLLFWIGGGGGIVLGVVLGKVLSVMGYGSRPHEVDDTSARSAPTSPS